jgi:hypothetical protein
VFQSSLVIGFLASNRWYAALSFPGPHALMQRKSDGAMQGMLLLREEFSGSWTDAGKAVGPATLNDQADNLVVRGVREGSPRTHYVAV